MIGSSDNKLYPPTGFNRRLPHKGGGGGGGGGSFDSNHRVGRDTNRSELNQMRRSRRQPNWLEERRDAEQREHGPSRDQKNWCKKEKDWCKKEKELV